MLQSVPFEKGFHFCVENGSYTGVTATSLPDFAEKLKTVDVNSVLFHCSRGDFQKWITNVIGDEVLADRITRISGRLPGEDLRKELVETAQTRLAELDRSFSHHHGTHHN